MSLTVSGLGRKAGLVALAAAGLTAATPAGPAGAAGQERAYEMVSPPEKGSSGVVFGHRASDDGDSVAFMTAGAISGEVGAYPFVTYVAHRAPSGWVTRGATPQVQAVHRGTSDVQANPNDFSDDFRTVYFYSNDILDPDDTDPYDPVGHGWWGYDLFSMSVEDREVNWLGRPTDDMLAVSRPGTATPRYVGRSRDGSRVFFSSDVSLTSGVTRESIYESVDGGLRLASVMPDGSPPPTTATSGLPAALSGSIVNADGNQSVSADGSRLFFRVGNVVYMREDGTRTLTVSASRRTGAVGMPAAATFLGATRDGATAYIHGTVGLTDDAVAGGNVYRWERDGERLTRLPLPAALARVGSDLSLLTENGKRLYFTSNTAILPGLSGSRHLYVWSEEGGVRHVATIGTGTAGPLDPRLRATRDGRLLAFTSVLDIGGARVGGRSSVYLYDAETGAVNCASCPADGSLPSGDAMYRSNDPSYSVLASAVNVNPRSFANDGRLYFQTSAALVPSDTNAAFDVYEYSDGAARLISTGRGGPSELVDNSADGTSVFFVTAEGLTAHDVDGGYPDVYVARVGGGMPLPPVGPTPCRDDACQGPPTLAPPVSTPGSQLLDGDAPVDEPEPKPRAAAVTVAADKPGAAALASFARTGRGALRVRVSAAGKITVTAKASVGGRGLVVANGSVSAKRRGAVRVQLRLTRAARRQLANGKTLRVRATVKHAGAAKAASVSFRLAPAKASNKTPKAGR